MEPPAKRRRQGESPLAGPSDDDDGDEFCFEPHEVLAKRDPGYKLSLERAYSDRRFQATMAHIFNKYGRDFEGIGDEIDMMTGEIVVDNGHLQNMRNECDVGIPGIGDEDGEDEGILLADLTDDEGDGPLRSQEPGEAEAADEDDEDEEDRIMHGREPEPPSTSLISTSRCRAMLPQSNGPSSFFSTLCDSDYPRFGPPPAFGASPLAFGISPFAMDPWAFPKDLSAPSRQPPHFLPRSSRLLPAGGRYNLSVQDGGGSIWAPNYRFKDDEQDRPAALPSLCPVRPPPRTRIKPMKRLLPSTAPKTSDEEEVDEDAILNGGSNGNEPRAQVDETGISDDEDLLISGITPLSKSDRTGARQAKPQPSKTGSSRTSLERAERGTPETYPSREKKRPRSSEATSGPQAAPKSQPSEHTQVLPAEKEAEQSTETKTESAQRLLERTRKQVEHPFKIPFSQTQGERRPQQRITVQLPPMDPLSRDDYELIDDVDEVADSADEDPGSSAPLERADDGKKTEPPRPEKVVADSQNTGSPQSSSSLQKKTQNSGRREPGKPQDAVNSAYLLSDDEMPILFKRKPPKSTKSQEKPAVRTTSAAPPDSGIGDSVVTLSAPEEAEQQKTANPAPEFQAAPEQPRKRSRTRVSETSPGSKVPEVPGEQQLSAKHGRAGGNPNPSADGGSRRLTKELRWLQRLNGPHLEPAHAPGTPANESRRTGSRSGRLRGEKPVPVQLQEENGDQHGQDDAPPETTTEASAVPDAVPDAAPDTPPKPSPAKHTPKPSPAKPAAPAQPPKPQTPRHASMPVKAPSRRSILSLLSSAKDSDDESDLDELGRGWPAMPLLTFSAASRKIWKSTPRTTEVYRTPIKRRPTDPASPGSIVKTPGGTMRTCGVDGYRCGRDFCFTCL